MQTLQRSPISKTDFIGCVFRRVDGRSVSGGPSSRPGVAVGAACAHSVPAMLQPITAAHGNALIRGNSPRKLVVTAGHRRYGNANVFPAPGRHFDAYWTETNDTAELVVASRPEELEGAGFAMFFLGGGAGALVLCGAAQRDLVRIGVASFFNPWLWTAAFAAGLTSYCIFRDCVAKQYEATHARLRISAAGWNLANRCQGPEPVAYWETVSMGPLEDLNGAQVQSVWGGIGVTAIYLLHDESGDHEPYALARTYLSHCS